MTKIFCIHPSVHDVNSFLAFTCLEGAVDPAGLQWDPLAPDILFATEWTFYRKDLFATFSKLYGRSKLKVAWMGEAVAADMNVFDYAVGFDAPKVGLDAVLSGSGASVAGAAGGNSGVGTVEVGAAGGNSGAGETRFIRLPSPLDMFHRFITNTSFRNELTGSGITPDTTFHEGTSFRNNLTYRCEDAKALLASKPKFCNFLYSNPDAHPMRDTLFRTLDAARGVDSLGKHLNNTGSSGTGYGNHYADCTTLKLPYRFSIASENAEYDGYTTEKIFTSLAAHTIPIYWGNRFIADDVNPACFINVRDFATLEDLVNYVECVDSDPELWASIVSQPWLTPAQEAAHRQRTADYRTRMAALLSGNASKAVPEGYHVDLYRKQFFKNGFAFDRSAFSVMLSAARSLVRRRIGNSSTAIASTASSTSTASVGPDAATSFGQGSASQDTNNKSR